MDQLKEQAEAAEEVGNLPLAFELWGKLADGDTNGLPSLKYGALAIQLQKWDVAESALMEASRLRPRAGLIMAYLGRLWAYRTDRDQTQSLQIAKQWYVKALERKRTAPLLTLLGAACVRLDQIPEAKAAFEEAIAIDPKYDEAMYNLAVLGEKNDPLRCIALLTRAVEIDPDYLIAHQMLGRTLQKQGDLKDAEFHFRRCLEIDPDEYWSNLYLANLLGVLGRNEEAEKAYRHAIALKPELEGGLRFFANFLKPIGKNTEAAALRSKAILISAHN
jgi:tetratricopeptide (TPR) repeat protein